MAEATEITQRIQDQRDYFLSGATLDIDFRLKALDRFSEFLHRQEASAYEALMADLNKSEPESYLTELSIVYHELAYIKKHLRSWAKIKHTRTSLAMFPARGLIVPEPYGVVLIMSPWNYPLNLTLLPIIAAIAAGNCCVVKPSSYSPKTSSFIHRLVTECFPQNHCCVVEGGRAENTVLLQQRFDYIFFTGSPTVGKLVMEAAAKHLTPVSLELGGKSPVIVDETADINLAAKRIVFGKYMNAGQTCIAPDYVYVHESRESALLAAIKHYIQEFYPAGDTPAQIADYPRIVNEKHFDRLLSLMEGAVLYTGGQSDKATLTIAPTVLTKVSWESPVMQEEIFGPILPVLTYRKLDELLALLSRKDKPLAHYLFSSDKKVQNKIMRSFSFGGGCINDTLLHIATPHLPFGGVGNSGMGSYHGYSSFRTFTHEKSIVDKGTHLDFAVRYRPYTKKRFKLLKKLQ